MFHSQIAEGKVKDNKISEVSKELVNTKKSLSDTKLALDAKAAEFNQVCYSKNYLP